MVRDGLWMAGLAAGALLVWRTRVCVPDAPYAFGSGDAFGYFLPAHAYEAERLAAGQLPLWNPYQGAGVPFLAMLQPGALHPARLLALLTTPADAMGWSAFAHLLLALLGTYALCRRVGTRPIPAAMGAIVFATAFALPWLSATSLLESGAWLPLLALGVVAILSGSGWGWVVALGVLGAMPLLAGGYQSSVYTVYGLILVAIAIMGERWMRGLPIGRSALGKLVVAGLLAVATAAPQLLATLSWTAETSRPPRQLTDVQMMTLFTEAARAYRLDVFFFRHSSADVCHLSLPVIMLVVVGIVGRRPLAIAVGLGAFATGLLTLVHPGSVFFSLYKGIPGFGMFRFPSRILVLTSLFAGVGSALGVDALTRARFLAAPARRLAVELLALGAVVALLVVPYRNLIMLPWTAPVAMTTPNPHFFTGATRPSADRRAWVPAGRFDLGVGAFVRQGMRHHVRVLQDYEPLSSRRLGAFLSAVAGLPPPRPDAGRLFDGAILTDAPVRRPQLLDLVAVGSMVTPRKTPPPVAAGWREVARWSDLGVYRNDRALPRAYVVARARFVSDEAAALEALTAAAFDGRSEAVLVGEPTADDARALAVASPMPALPTHIALDEPERVVVEVEPEAPGLLVLADAFAPGWEATVDGVPRRLWQANHLVRGVIVHVGDRRVEFRYRAPGFMQGVALAAISWSVVLLTLATSRVRRRAAAACTSRRASGRRVREPPPGMAGSHAPGGSTPLGPSS